MTTTYTYDTLGDQTTATTPVATTTYTYDQTGQMTAAATPGSDATYLYDAAGLTAATTTTAGTAQYTWNQTGSLPLILSDGTNDYIYGPGATPAEQIALSSSTPTYLSYTQADDTWVSSNQSGDETGFWGYDAYGTLAYGTPASPFGYSGQYQDATTGFVNDRARWFSPGDGEFTTVDPELAKTDTAYTYGDDDPVTDADPTGLEDVLGDHATCQDVTDGHWHATLCVQVNTSSFLFMDESSEPQAVWVVTSGAIEDAGAELLNMEVCGSHGPYPGHPRGCHQNDDPTNSPSAKCGGKQWYLNGGWYTNSEVNWEDAWVDSAWLKWEGGPRLKATVSLHETPLCRIGNGGRHVCDPNW